MCGGRGVLCSADSWDSARLDLIERAARQLYNLREWNDVIKVLELEIICARSLEDVDAQARSWTHLGMAALEIEDYDLAEHAKQQAEGLSAETEHSAWQGDLASLSQQLFAVEISKDLIDRDPKKIVAAHRARPYIGRDILRTKIDEALAAANPNAAEIGDAYCAIATLSEYAGRTDWAFSELFEGLANLRRLKLWQRRADLLLVCAIILMRHRRARSAWRALRAALVARRRFDPHRNVGPLLACIGRCVLALSEGSTAAELIAELEGAGEFEPEWGSPDGLLILSQLHQKWGDAGSAATFAEALLDRTAKQPETERRGWAMAWAAIVRVRQQRLDQAEELATEVLEISRRKLRSEPEYDRLNWRHIGVLASEALLAAWYEPPTSRRGNAARSLALVEEIRLRSLRQRFGHDFMVAPHSLPDELKRKERYLLAMHRIRTDPRQRPEDRWKRGMFDILDNGETETIEKFSTNLPEPWREYGLRRLGEAGDPQSVVKEALEHCTAHLLVLYSTEFGTYRWLVLCDGSIAAWTRSPVTLSEAQRFTLSFLSSVAMDNPPPPDEEKFTTDLLGSAFEEIPENETICLVPSGPLLQLPFSALSSENRYLVERNPIVILPAISLLPYWTGKKRDSEIPLVLGDSLGDLHGARDEATAVAELLNTQPLLGSAVDRTTLMPALYDCAILHVACHAFYNERDASGSGFWLSDKSVFSARDFTESEIRVGVADLSACESGLLDVAAADELAGLAASMLLCGASTVVSTLWRIPDQNTVSLITSFYKDALSTNADLAVALAQAQRAMIANASTRRPFHWAAFELFGLWIDVLQRSDRVAEPPT
jgi:hypothetical protein